MLQGFRVDGQALLHPCHCGAERFDAAAPLRFDDCTVARCRACGQLRTVPEPRDLDVVYSQETLKYATAAADDPHRRELWAGFADAILDDVQAHVAGPGRLLDVGCNLGDLLVRARGRGWEAEGLEINAPTAEHVRAQGFHVYGEELQDAGIPDGVYDAVIANQIVEHVVDPVAFLREIRRVLRPGGVAFVGVPCFTGPIPLALKRSRWYALVPEEHIWQFGPLTLRRVVRRAGLDIARVRRGSSGFWGTLEPNPRSIARWTTYRLVDALGQGDFIHVLATRPLAPGSPAG